MSSSIFDQYRTINYPIKIKQQTIYKPVRDITTNIRFDQSTIDNTVNYNYITVHSGELPEITASKVYDNPKDNYLVMIANDDFDWRNDYPLTDRQLQQYVNDKYSNPNAIHHYIDYFGNIVDNTYKSDEDLDDFAYSEMVIPVTNYEYEYQLNESKRTKKIIKSRFVDLVVNTIKRKIK